MTFITDEQLKALAREREEPRALGIDLGKLQALTPELCQRLFALNNPNRNIQSVVTKGNYSKDRALQKQ